MTVSTTTTTNSFSGNGSTTAFAYSFKIFATGEMIVILRSATGTETVQTISTHYSISGTGSASGGTVTFGSAPAVGVTVLLKRATALTQATDYVENDPFPAATHEDALDKLTHTSQELQEEVDRSIKLSRTNTMTSTEFTDNAAARASKVLAFDSSGELSVTQELGTFTGNWAASTAYSIRDLIKDNSAGKNNIWICITAHTSSGSLPIDTNTDAAKWNLIVDATSATASAAAAATSATASASSATASASSASTASGHKDTATTKAAEAATSATAGASSASAASSSATAGASSATAAASSATSSAASAAAALVSAYGGLDYAYSTTTTDSDPGAGVIRLNHATLSSVTAAYLDDTDANSVDVSTYLLTWDDSTTTALRGTLKMVKKGTQSTYALYNITGASTDASGYVKLALTHVASNGTFSDADTVSVHHTRTGDTGSFSSGAVDLNGEKLTLDADADTSIHASTDDQIDIEIAGADDFRFTANTLTALSGSTIATDTIAETTAASGVTIDGLLIKDSTAAFADGAVATPSITNTGDLNTGVYFPAADTVGVVAGGTEQFRFGSNPIPGGSKNMLINGAMTINQRGSVTATVNTPLLDMFASTLYDAGTSAVATVTKDNDSPAGFGSSMKFDVTTIATGGGDYNSVKQRIEAQNLQHLKYGTADALTCTFSFWFKTTITGIYSAYFYHMDAGYTYIREFTVASSNTWEFFQVTVPGYTSTNFGNDTGPGLEVGITLASDSGTGAVDTWQAGGDTGGSTNQVNGLSSTSNNIFTTGWQFEVGSVATDFSQEAYGTTLQKCQRYFERRSYGTADTIAPGVATTATVSTMVLTYQEKRAAPTFSFAAATTYRIVDKTNSVFAGSGIAAGAISPTTATVNLTHSSATTGGAYFNAVSTTHIDISAEL